ncbi:MAG: hypothetical protein KKC75_08845 [Nanoarchaeota archaeon]|nr:hypothetical protein [Nanoarchaeota archaeon]MBU1004952.1 hypothetical protein [Nanoarchaeota archaeon]MBU1946408.1 hypothetical protein [Nanoarchaeota archaeon]
MKKGQAAMEFLMTYGWAILVVIISIGALAYFGAISPQNFLPEKCVISTGSGLFCKEFTSSSSADTITLRIHNILPSSVDIEGITTDEPSCSLSSCTSDPIPSDGESDCTLDCSGGLNAKDNVKADLAISYKLGDSTLEKSTSGSIVMIVP